MLVNTVNNPTGCIAVQIVKAWGGHVTAIVSSRGLLIAQQLGVDDVIICDGAEADLRATVATRDKFNLVINTTGSDCYDVCADVVSTVTAPPASDQYGVLFGVFYSLWLRVRLCFQRVGFCITYNYRQYNKVRATTPLLYKLFLLFSI